MDSSWFAQWSVRPRARLLRSRAGCAPQRGVRSLLRERPSHVLVRFYVQCWVPARLQPRARGDRLVHSGPPVQVVKEVVHVGQDGRSRHAWGSRSGWSARFSSRFLRGDVQVRSLAVSFLVSCPLVRWSCVCCPCVVIQRRARRGRAWRPVAGPPAWSGALGSRCAPLSGSWASALVPAGAAPAGGPAIGGPSPPPKAIFGGGGCGCESKNPATGHLQRWRWITSTTSYPSS
jgi:hypothetical protein